VEKKNLVLWDYYEIIAKGTSWPGTIGPIGSMSKRSITSYSN